MTNFNELCFIVKNNNSYLNYHYLAINTSSNNLCIFWIDNTYNLLYNTLPLVSKLTKHMKFGFRIPNLNKRIAARTSLKRIIRHNVGIKAPKGWGWLTDPERAAYNKVYNKTSKGCLVLLPIFLSCIILIIIITTN